MPEEYFWHFDVPTLYAELIQTKLAAGCLSNGGTDLFIQLPVQLSLLQFMKVVKWQMIRISLPSHVLRNHIIILQTNVFTGVLNL